MPEIRCPNCRFALWLYTGTAHRHDLRPPEECPRCHVRRPIDANTRLAARLASTRPGAEPRYQPAARPPAV